MASAAGSNPGLGSFLADALRPVFTRRLLVPTILLALLLTISNIVLLLNLPEKGRMPPPAVFVAAAARVLGLAVLAVAMLRILTDSPRRPWRPDGAFWLYLLTIVAGIALSIAVGAVIGGVIGGDRSDPLNSLASGVLITLISAPFAVWFTAIAVERPLALRPRPWMRAWSLWLPPLLFWALLVITPVGLVHGAIDGFLVRGAGDWFWPLALFDGPFSVLIPLGTYALAAEAYRRVARS